MKGNHFPPSPINSILYCQIKEKRKKRKRSDLNRAAPEGCHWPMGQ